MNHRRTILPAQAFPPLLDEAGKRLQICRYCKGPTPTRRHSWCSEECNEQAMIECGYQGYARSYLWRHQQGVCQRCGRDTEALRRAFVQALSRRRRADDTSASRAFWRRINGALRRQMRDAGFTVDLYAHGRDPGQSLWEADHIVPLIEGGDRSAANLQTLCTPCHKADTAELARRLADARSGQPRLDLRA